MFSLWERYGCRFHLEWVYSFCPSGIEVRRVVCQKELYLRLKGLVVSTAAKFHDFFVYSSSRRLRSNGCGFLGPHRLKSLRFFLGSLERWCFFGELPVPMLPLGHQGTWLSFINKSDSVFDLTTSDVFRLSCFLHCNWQIYADSAVSKELYFCLITLQVSHWNTHRPGKRFGKIWGWIKQSLFWSLFCLFFVGFFGVFFSALKKISFAKVRFF